MKKKEIEITKKDFIDFLHSIKFQRNVENQEITEKFCKIRKRISFSTELSFEKMMKDHAKKEAADEVKLLRQHRNINKEDLFGLTSTKKIPTEEYSSVRKNIILKLLNNRETLYLQELEFINSIDLIGEEALLAPTICSLLPSIVTLNELNHNETDFELNNINIYIALNIAEDDNNQTRISSFGATEENDDYIIGAFAEERTYYNTGFMSF